MKRLSLFLSVLILLLAGAACGGGPKKGRCDVSVFTPDRNFTQAMLLDPRGMVIDSTLTVVNDSIIFSRCDTAAMPYVATLRICNPNDSLQDISLPIVIEGGIVRVEISNVVSLSGTSDNDALYKFLKARNSMLSKFSKQEDHDVERMKEEYSGFLADQILLNKGTVVGEYIMQTYQELLSKDDAVRVKERMKK